MKVTVVYVYPGDVVPKSVDYAWRFVASYRRFPPGAEHETVVVLNNTRLTPGVQFIFKYLPNVQYLHHDDSGWDIGAYQAASRAYPDADLMVFFGTSVYFKNPNWLLRYIHAAQKYGLGLYGAMGNRGDLPIHVYPHIRTTGFAIKPSLLNRYPKLITKNNQRYEFEHGKTCLSEWIKKLGLPVLVVTTNGEWEWKDWDLIPNGYRRGDESALLIGDRITDLPFKDSTNRIPQAQAQPLPFKAPPGLQRMGI